MDEMLTGREVRAWLEGREIARLGERIHPPFGPDRRAILDEPISFLYTLDQWLIDRFVQEGRPFNVLGVQGARSFAMGVPHHSVWLQDSERLHSYALNPGGPEHLYSARQRVSYILRYRNIYAFNEDIFTMP